MVLARFGYDIYLPDDDLTHLGFFLTVLEAWDWSSRMADSTLPEDEPYGYLSAVPFLRGVPYEVQLDLLARAWAKHLSPVIFEGSLLEAAVVYAACESAAELILQQPELVREELTDSVRAVGLAVNEETAERLRDRFADWWGDEDFLLISEWEDRNPELVAAIKERLGIDDEAIDPLFEALGQARATPWIGTNLQGLLSPDDIKFVSWVVGLEVVEDEE